MTKEDNKNIKKVTKFYFAWDEDKEAHWLNEMSNKGWHLKGYSLFKYTFEKGAPKNFIYQFDYRLKTANDEEYLELFSDSGWTFITKFSGWYFFRKIYQEGEQNEIYSDDESLKGKYNKLIKFSMFSLFPLLSALFLLIILTVIDSNFEGVFKISKYFWIIIGFILIGWLYAFIRIVLVKQKKSDT